MAPHLTVERGEELTRGRPVVIEGRAFVDGCRDTMACTEVEWPFDAPAGARPGPARLHPDGGEPLRGRIG